jgi:hypothetical protein
MIKLFSVKQKQKEAAESANGRAPVKKQSAGELRVQKGMLSHLSSACSLNTNCVCRCWISWSNDWKICTQIMIISYDACG